MDWQTLATLLTAAAALLGALVGVSGELRRWRRRSDDEKEDENA